MKRNLLISLLIAFMISFHIKAQDLIVTNNGETMKAYNLEMSSESVYYSLEEAQDAPLHKLAKSEILVIKQADGTVLSFSTNSAEANEQKAEPTATKSEQSGIMQVSPESLSADAKSINDSLIARINAPVDLIFKERDLKFVGERQANYADACFGVKTNSLLCNDDIEVSMIIGQLTKPRKGAPAEWSETSWKEIDPAVKFLIKNKTDQTLYIDLGNTFYIVMGQSIRYYIPSITTTSNTTKEDENLTLYAPPSFLNPAFGMGVGISEINTYSNTVYSERVLHIPPRSTVGLNPQYLIGNEYKVVTTGCWYESYAPNCSFIFRTNINFSYNSQEGVMKVGDRYSYTESSSPIQLSFVVAYSKEVDCSHLKSMSSSYYLKELLGLYYTGVVKGNLSRKDLPYFHVRISDNKNGTFPKQ